MHKAIVVLALFCLLPAGAALADDDIGCGLGTQIFAGKSGIVFKVLGATTNGSFGNQTFGITSGTLGCSSGGVVSSKERINMFAGANLDKLAKDMSVGQGESLDALAQLYGMSGAHKGLFFQMTKTHYGELFSSETVTAGQLLTNLDSLMAADAKLAGYARQS